MSEQNLLACGGLSCCWQVLWSATTGPDSDSPCGFLSSVPVVLVLAKHELGREEFYGPGQLHAKPFISVHL